MLQISHLSFSYHDQIIFQNLNLNFSASEIIAIIGDNGAGKTTLLRLIARELIPDDGAIRKNGDIRILHQSGKLDDSHPQSGGERTRAELTALFRASPRILLLDEPTNNLDAENKTWLIDQLHKYRGLALVVSHDRGFIDAIADKVLEIHNHSAQLFPRNYSDFITRRIQAEHEQCLAYAKIQRQKKQLMRQLKAANDQAHKSNRRSYNKIDNESKLHYNGQRMGAQNSAGKIIRATQSKLDQLPNIAKPIARKTYTAQLTHHINHQKTLLEVTDLCKSYSNKNLFQNLNFTITTGNRVRVAGRNGAGKSTLFQIIMGKVAADSGIVRLSPSLKLGYISQGDINLGLNRSFLAQCSGIHPTEIYRAAVTMDFSPSDMSRPVGELSRGQLTKLAILQLILKPLDLVILDEITNHLDIRARENIELALQNYRGAILAATHDEVFAENVGFEQTIPL